jgi:hypothetical protein
MENYAVFPTNKPNKSKFHAINQIDFMLSGVTNGLMNVLSYNNYLPNSQPYLWRIVPGHYKANLLRALFRLEMLKVAAKDTRAEGGNPWHIEHAQLNLLYMDTVLDLLWEDALVATSKNKMSKAWRSAAFDQWIFIEYYVRRHSPMYVDPWLKKDPSNSSLLTQDIHVLGLFH